MNAIDDQAVPVDKERVEHIKQRLLSLRDIRLARLKAVLDADQRDFLDLLPLLFHTNQVGLPGFVAKDCPADLPAYTPSIQAIQLARERYPDVELDWRVSASERLSALYLVGGPGGLGRDHSLAFWLCHADALSEQGLASLHVKCEAIAQAGDAIGLDLSVRLLSEQQVRDGCQASTDGDPEAGDVEPHLLLEHFYRTAVLLAGLHPVWWLLPETDDTGYAQQVQQLHARGIIQPDEWLDFGPPAGIPPAELIRAARKGLLQALVAPYPALNGLMLASLHADEYPHARWLCQDIKAAVHGEASLESTRLDPDYAVLDRLSRHPSLQQDTERLGLARRSFYYASGIRIGGQADDELWRNCTLVGLVGQWGWDSEDIERLEDRDGWPLDELLSEQALIVDELSRSFKVLNTFATTYLAEDDAERETLSLVGRKLYAAVGQRTGKVDLLHHCGSCRLQENELYLNNKDGEWQLRRRPPLSKDSVVIKATDSLVAMLAWAYLNGLATPDTALSLPAVLQSRLELEPKHIFEALVEGLPTLDPDAVALHAFAGPASARLSLVFVNIGIDPLANLSALNLQRATGRGDPLSFSGTHNNLVKTLDHLVVTNWDEVLVTRYTQPAHGLLDMLCRHLNLSDPLVHDVSTPLQAQCFTSARAEAIVERLQVLAGSLADCFRQHGADAAYILLLEDCYYLIERAETVYRWKRLGDKAALVTLLRDPSLRARPLKMDPVSFAKPGVPPAQAQPNP